MGEYVIVTDSSCDLSSEMVQELQITVTPLTFYMDDVAYRNTSDWNDIAPGDFYGLLHTGKQVRTSAVNIADFEETFEPFLQKGQDILYLGFSSGLSGTYQSAVAAMDTLREKYPERTMEAVDTLCASLGQGLLIYLVAQKRKEGFSLSQARDFAEEAKLHICHWFTVSDLHFLKKGGRIHAATEIIGTLLNICPVMHMNDEGHLTHVEVARGRKGAIKGLLGHMEKTVVDPQNQVVFISHGNCEEDAMLLADLVRKKLQVRDVIINYVGPVIGAHSGPGTLALFFYGENR